MAYTSTILYLGDLRTQASHCSSGSVIETDAPIDNNGKGALFSPTDLTATSLANCMITVMGIAANAGKIDVKNVKASGKKVMAAEPRRISEINVTMESHHSWNEKEKSRMQHIPLNCPVAKRVHPSIQQIVEFKYLD